MKLSLNNFLAAGLLFSIFFIPLIDTDFGWHYRCGEQIVRQGKLCATNNFTTLLAGYHWNSPSHGYQILLYLLYRLGHFPLLAVFYGFSAAVVFLFFLNSLKGDLWLKLIFFLPLVWFAWITFGLGFRSQILSIYFLAIFLALRERAYENPKILFGTIPLMFLWANVHSGFFLGAILSLFLVMEYFELNFRKRFVFRNFLFIMAIVAANFLVTLVNPLGAGIYQEALRHAQVPLKTLIAEWLPSYPWQSLLIKISALTAALILLRFGRRRVFRLLVLILTAYLAVEARRSLPLFSLGLTYAFWQEEIGGKLSHFFQKVSSRELLIFIFLPFFLLNLKTNLPASLSFDEKAYCQKALVPMPCGAVEFLKKQNSANVFNAYEWGGFLDWQLPTFKFFVDGRMPSWDTVGETRLPQNWRGKSPYTVYLETLQTQPGWQQILDAYETKYILILPGNALDILLRPDPVKYGYREVFFDGISIIYQKG